MVLLKKLFAAKDPLKPLRRAVVQQRWADVLREAAVIRQDVLSPELLEELQTTLEQAGNRLAGINLEEGEACLRGGKRDQAMEHFQLAAEHARSESLQSLIRQRLEESALVVQEKAVSAQGGGSPCCASGCATAAESAPTTDHEMDVDSRLELSLTSYPPELATRYLNTRNSFKQALLLAFAGAPEEALTAFDRIAEQERDDLYQFERGALLLRLGQPIQGRDCLQQALALNPRQQLAMETLVTLDLMENQWENAESRLQQMLAAGISMPFCYSRLAELHAGNNDLVTAISYAEQALASGPVELDTLVLLSDCLEKTGRIEKAEAVLSSLPGSGCGGGGAHVLLAEFWLRHGKSLPQALEAFKSASRQDPGNLRWPLRIAQTCLALNRHKEGQDLLEKILSAPGLSADLRREAEENFSFYGK